FVPRSYITPSDAENRDDIRNCKPGSIHAALDSPSSLVAAPAKSVGVYQVRRSPSTPTKPCMDGLRRTAGPPRATRSSYVAVRSLMLAPPWSHHVFGNSICEFVLSPCESARPDVFHVFWVLKLMDSRR